METVNFAKTEYIDLISEYEKNNFFDEAYSKETLLEMLKDNYLLKDNDNIFVIKNEDEVIGYVIFHISKDFTDIYKIFIRENNRRKRYATKLLEEVEKISKRYDSKKIMIEVRAKNNNAIIFYSKNGFKNISIRKDYYKNPKDDALIFEKNFEV